VLYAKYDAKFPSDSTELLGRFVGIAENVGHSMTYKILTEDDKIIYRAVARTARKTGGFENVQAKDSAPQSYPRTKVVTVEDGESDDEEEEKEEESSFVKKAKEDILKSVHEDRVNKGELLPTIDSTGLLGRTFIPDPDENGEQKRAKLEAVELTGNQTADGKEEIYKFRARVGDKTFEHIMTYNKMLEWCDRDLDKDDMYRIEAVIGHNI